MPLDVGSQVTHLPDAVGRSLLLRIAPRVVVPYLQLARLDRPVGYWLLVLPCWWSSALASLANHRPLEPMHFILFLFGAIVMRGAGSTYNDIVDRHVDAQVERTRNRPLASGRVGVLAALLFVVAQAFAGLAVVIQFNVFTILLGTGSLAIVSVYPFAKKITWCPQLVLGLAFAWGGLIGWSALTGSLAAPAIAIYAAAVAWTVGYDTIYAIQDERDDQIAGIKSSARFFGRHLRLAVALLYAVAVLLVELSLDLGGAAGSFFAQAGIACFSLHLGWQVFSLQRGNRERALRLFRSNRDAGLILAAGLAAAAALTRT